jgi:hypothetical protein
MRILKILACLALLIAPVTAQAGEKPKAQSQIEAARAAIEAFSKRSDDNKLVTGDLEAARTLLKKGEEAFAGGRAMFGLGDINPQAALDVKHFTDMVDLYLILGQSRIDKARAEDELKAMSSQVAKMKGKVKVFDDRKAELEKLRASVVKFEAIAKELEEVKAEKARLAEKVAKLELERKTADVELERLKGELAKRDLAAPVAPAAPTAPVDPSAPAAPAALAAPAAPAASPVPEAAAPAVKK